MMMDDELPKRMFEFGFEPNATMMRINNYFNLRWVDIIRDALEDADIEMLMGSQFGNLMQMGKHTFSVKFVHYLLTRQLVTNKKNELWWLFAGKPIRFGIEDFAFVTGLNCANDTHHVGSGPDQGKGKLKRKGKASAEPSELWKTLFHKEQKPTTDWVLDKLMEKKRYKDARTRLKLSLLLLVEGLLCPTSRHTIIRPEVVDMLEDIDAFLKYPWGRDSFLLTVRSAKSRQP